MSVRFYKRFQLFGWLALDFTYPTAKTAKMETKEILSSPECLLWVYQSFLDS